METWKDVKGFEGKYQVSDLGNVKSLKRKRKARGYIRERVLKPIEGIYLSVVLWGENPTRKPIHRLVIETFLPNPNGYKYCNHKDGNKHNNALNNLEWCTKSYNQIHAYANGLRKEGKQTSKYRGVYDSGVGSKRWRAQVYRNNKCNYLGYYYTEKEAHQAREQYLHA